MADLKISELTNLTAADPANDMIPIVDVSATPPASGSTKRISINNILACSPSATLASATISGDLTVDTSTLKVDSANNRVGIGTASPLFPLDIISSGATTVAVRSTGAVGLFRGYAITDGTTEYGQFKQSLSSGELQIVSGNAGWGGFLTVSTGGSERYRIASDGVATWSNVGGVASTAMTLNSTGLGVGVSPSYQIHARKDQAAFTTVAIDNHNAIAAGTGTQFLLIDGGTNAGWFRRNRDGTGNTDIGYKDTLRFRGQIAGTERTDMTLDTSGNVGIGVTSLSRKFEVHGTPVTIGGTATGMLVTVANNGTAYNASPTSGFALWNKFNSSGSLFPSAAIQAGKENATDGNYAGFLSLYTVNSVGTPNEQMRIDSSGNVVVNTAAVATTATDGFLYITGCAGTPTGTPTAKTGRVPLVVDTTNNKLYFYSGGAWVAAN